MYLETFSVFLGGLSQVLLMYPLSSIVNVPGESTLRRDFIRLQQENKERSEALRRQQLLQEQQLREQEEYKRQLLAERQKRIEQQKEQRRLLEEVGLQYKYCDYCLKARSHQAR